MVNQPGPQRDESPPDRGFRKIGKQPGGTRGAAPPEPRRQQQAEVVGGLSPAFVASGFMIGLLLPVALAVLWAPPAPSAQTLFDIVTLIVKNPPQQWGCAASSSPNACDEWLECAKLQEVARVGEETAEQVIHYTSQRMLASAVLCNQNFVGACGSLWLPVDSSLLGPSFSLPGHTQAPWLCRQLLHVAATGRRIRQQVTSKLLPQSRPLQQPTLSQLDLESRSQVALEDEVEKLRQKVDGEGGELVFMPDKRRGERGGEDSAEKRSGASDGQLGGGP